LAGIAGQPFTRFFIVPMDTINHPAFGLITLLGLGPGHPGLVTREAWQALEGAESVFLRTRRHPVVEDLPAHLAVVSFDEAYDQAETFEQVYEGIVERILHEAAGGADVVYAVPGHPMIAESTGPEILRAAAERGIPIRVLQGISFIEPVFTALGLDPFPQTTFLDAFELARQHVPSFPVDQPVLIAQIHSPRMASEVKLSLMSLYPDEHAVRLVHAAGTEQEAVEELPLYEIDRSDSIGLLTALYVPPLAPLASFESLHEVVAHLRAPEGCPWDREQTHLSLRPYLLEEAYEVLHALDGEDPEALQEELGDLLFQVVFHAVIAEELGDFRISDVVQGIAEKLVRRHPHVFGDVEVDGVAGVLQNWDRIKAEEKTEKGSERESILDGVPLAMPALSQAAAIQRRASRVGFEWPDIDGVFDKIHEEVDELRIAADPEERAAELGDLFFALSHLGNWLEIDPEDALRTANLRFRRRFQVVERLVSEEGQAMTSLSLDRLNEFWLEAKKQVG